MYTQDLIIGLIWVMVCTIVMPARPMTLPGDVTPSGTTYHPYTRHSDHLDLRLDLLDSFHVHKISDVPMKQMNIHYNVTFKTDKCCPIIYVFAQTPNPPYNSSHVDARCFVGGPGFVHVSTFSDYIIYMKEFREGCVRQGEYIYCTGLRKLAFAMNRTWYFAVGYPCEDKQLLNMHIQLEFDFNAPVTCELLTVRQCGDMFNQTMTAMPNRIGQSRQSDAAKLLRAMDLMLSRENCYQHDKAFVCNGLFQDCRRESIYPPCQQACLDFVEGCREPLEKWNQRVRCGNFPPSLDPSVCSYMPVTCPLLSAPKHGSIFQTGHNLSSTTEYTCDSGYDLIGASRRICLLSGKWNGTEPECVETSTEEIQDSPIGNHKWLLILGCLSILLIGIMLGMCVRFRSHVILLVLHNHYVHDRLNTAPPGVGGRKKKVFLTYSSLDSDGIEKDFLPNIKRHLPQWDIITFEKDFIPGRSLIDSVNESIWQSQAVLVMLTANYIASEWCEYEFSEAQTRFAKDNQFRLIIILQDKEGEVSVLQDFDKMSEDLKSFLKTRIYLRLNERLFWNKLRRGLTE